MCGVVGILAKGAVNQELYDALTMLQHRGQDAAGVMTCNRGHFYLRKGNGLVRDVIRAEHMLRLQGNMGIGHVRYPTAGSASSAEAQPLYVNSPYGLAIVHNGNLINTQALQRDVLRTHLRHLNTHSDSEVLLNIFAYELQKIGKIDLDPSTLFQAVRALHRRCKGGYATVIMIAGYGLVGIRDPNGIRPLVYGKRETNAGTDYMIASESVALDALGYQLLDDVQGGEAVFIDLQGQLHRQQCADNPAINPCIFEYVYLARPDSILDKISVHQARLHLGEKLAEKILREHPQHDIDVVIPIPDTSRTAALPLAEKLGITYREGFIKNRYIGRTFIMPGQKLRRKSVRQKLNAIGVEFKDKNVLLVDDSIVRGTTSKEIIQMARDAGAKKVYFASAAPEVRYPNVYGIDMPSSKELIANQRTSDEIAKLIGADWLIYQDLTALYEAVGQGNPQISRFEDSVFTGNYITGGVDQNYLQQLEQARSENAKPSLQMLNDEGQVVEVYNNE
ncbi:MAG: amidophosphoribosyltransferase [Gammaproteobacteria bacterium]